MQNSPVPQGGSQIPPGSLSGTGTGSGEQLRMLQLLIDVSKKVAMEESLGQMLASLGKVTSEETGAERSTIFLHDNETSELFSGFAQGESTREIRFIDNVGIAGHVFTTGGGLIIDDAYECEYFDPRVDKETGFITKNVLCTPLKTVKGQVIGVVQSLNKMDGNFTAKDKELVESIATHVAATLQSFQTLERLNSARETELDFLNIVSDITSELELGPLLQKVMGEATRMLKAERSTLFLNDEKTNELWSQVGQGLDATSIRLPNHMGIAGAVFTKGQTINIPYAYADLRFNPAFDKQTGFFTRSILCVPVVNKDGKTIGVTQVLNKQGGPFTSEDEQRLKAFTAQISIGLENAKLFDDVQNIKNYNEAMLESMSNGVLTLDEEGRIYTCNAAGLRILRVEGSEIIGQSSHDFFGETAPWILDLVARVEASGESEIVLDTEIKCEGDKTSVNITVQPLLGTDESKLGSLILIEDISSEKRVKSTMARYMDPHLADQLMADGEEFLGGQTREVSVLFSDIRGFTTLSEVLGAQGIVSLLNEYFTLMVDCIQREEGMLDKFIGDAIMAEFGMPVSHDDDPDRALRTAVDMIVKLREFNARRIGEGLLPVDIGIGINSGPVVSGNIGSPKRMDYTVIGDGVNLAARLESACKQYNAAILVSEHTFNQLHGTYRNREIDRVIVKGKTEPVGVYEILEHHNTQTFTNMADVLGHFKNGVELYRGQDWDKATKYFQYALDANPDDKLSHTYIQRCQRLRANPPGNEWDGVWTMTSK